MPATAEAADWQVRYKLYGKLQGTPNLDTAKGNT